MAIELPFNPLPSFKEFLAAQTPEEVSRVLRGMSIEKQRALKRSWRSFHARPEQVEPQLWEVRFTSSSRGRFLWTLAVESSAGVKSSWSGVVTTEDETPEAMARALWLSVRNEAREGEEVEMLAVLRGTSVMVSPARPLSLGRTLVFRLQALDAKGAQYEWGMFQWRVWLAMCGRGWGKTHTGANWVIEQARQSPRYPGAIIGASPDEVRAVMVEGQSGILTCCPKDFMPEWNPGLGAAGQLVFPNGAIVMGYSGAKADKLRGPGFRYAWVDELPKFAFPSQTWDQLQFALRAPGSEQPRVLVTTTPRPVPVMRAIVDDPMTVLVKGNTRRNQANLAASFLSYVETKYGNTRLGRQELNAELLDDVVGALWSQRTIDACLLEAPPTTVSSEIRGVRRVDAFRFMRIVVAVDPSVSGGEAADAAETGIIVMGLGNDGHVYVIDDKSGDFGIQDGTVVQEVVGAYRRFDADAVVVEVNNGGDWIPALIHAFDPKVRVVKKKASTGKQTRAEPIAAMYERGLIHHLTCPLLEGERYPRWSELFSQLTTWTPEEKSPDRLDALVWGVAELSGINLSKKEGTALAATRVGKKRVINFTGASVGRSRMPWQR